MPRDFSQPYTEEELENLREIFRSLPSYKPGGWIFAKDIPRLVGRMEYPRTQGQIDAYQKHWEQHCGGIITLEAFIESASQIYKTPSFARDYAIKLDKHGEGSISQEDFVVLLDLMKKHDPKFEGKTLAHFVADMGIEPESRVSIDECTKWFDALTTE